MATIKVYDGATVNLYINDDYKTVFYFLYENNEPLNLEKDDFAMLQIQINPVFPLVSSMAKVSSKEKQYNELIHYTNEKLLKGEASYDAYINIFGGDRKLKHVINFTMNIKKEATDELSNNSVNE